MQCEETIPRDTVRGHAVALQSKRNAALMRGTAPYDRRIPRLQIGSLIDVPALHPLEGAGHVLLLAGLQATLGSTLGALVGSSTDRTHRRGSPAWRLPPWFGTVHPSMLRLRLCVREVCI